MNDGNGGGADGGELEAREGCFASGAFAVDVVEGSGSGAFHVVVIEVLEDVKVGVGGYVGDDVDGAGCCCGGLLLGVGGVEGEDGVGFVYSDMALTMASVDYEPEVLFARIEAHHVDQISRPEDFGATEGEIRIVYTENHVVFCQEDWMKICRSDRSAGEMAIQHNGGFPHLGGHGEDSIRCLPTNLEIVIVPISSTWMRT